MTLSNESWSCYRKVHAAAQRTFGAFRFCLPYLFLEPDCPFVQDGTRLDEVERNTLSIRHKEELGRNGIKYISLPGSWEDRFLSARAIIDKLWPNKKEGQ
ncbi:MAG TPA: AAA family ATPase [Chitinophagaceae bacterium]